MIYYFTPYSDEKRLGRAINLHCSLVPSPDDWIAITDADTMFLHPDYGRLLSSVIENHGKDYGMFTCYATRSGALQTRWKGIISEERDLVKLYDEVMECAAAGGESVTEFETLLSPVRQLPSGFFMLFQKAMWDKFIFSNQYSILDVDHSFISQVVAAGYKIGRIDGLLLVHYYRLKQGGKNISQLLISPNDAHNGIQQSA